MMRTLEQAYEHFNASLFERELPPLFFNLSRSKKGVTGFFAPGAWREAGETLGRHVKGIQAAFTWPPRQRVVVVHGKASVS